MILTKDTLCLRLRRLLDRIDSENRRPSDGESVALEDICARIAAGELDAADTLLAKVEQANLDRDTLQGRPLSTAPPTTADWREQLNELAD